MYRMLKLDLFLNIWICFRFSYYPKVFMYLNSGVLTLVELLPLVRNVQTASVRYLGHLFECPSEENTFFWWSGHATLFVVSCTLHPCSIRFIYIPTTDKMILLLIWFIFNLTAYLMELVLNDKIIYKCKLLLTLRGMMFRPRCFNSGIMSVICVLLSSMWIAVLFNFTIYNDSNYYKWVSDVEIRFIFENFWIIFTIVDKFQTDPDLFYYYRYIKRSHLI